MRIIPPAVLTAALSLSLAAALPALAQPAGCPPGLQKKSPACVPPGLAKKQGGAESDVIILRKRDDDRVRDDDDDDVVYWVRDDGRRYRRGDPLFGDDVVYVRPRDLARLPLLEDGHSYVRVDNQVVEIVEAGNLFVRTIGAASDLLN